MVQPDTPQMENNMVQAQYLPDKKAKTRDAHILNIQYLIIIYFPQQKLFRERASTLR
jgi:hypothetical protein